MLQLKPRRGVIDGCTLTNSMYAAIKKDGTFSFWGTSYHNLFETAPIGKFISVLVSNDKYGGYSTSSWGIASDEQGFIHTWGTDFEKVFVNKPTDDGYLFTLFLNALNNYPGCVSLKQDGEIVFWGTDVFVARMNANKPTRKGYIDIAHVGFEGIVALHEDGSVESFGATDRIGVAPTGNNFIDIGASRLTNFYALTNENRIVTWSGSAVTDPLIPPDGLYKKLGRTTSLGYSIGGAIDINGEIVVWGDDTYGQVSNIPTGNDYETLYVGDTCFAIKTDGTMIGWGSNNRQVLSTIPTTNDFWWEEQKYLLQSENTIFTMQNNKWTNTILDFNNGFEINSVNSNQWNELPLYYTIPFKILSQNDINTNIKIEQKTYGQLGTTAKEIITKSELDLITDVNIDDKNKPKYRINKRAAISKWGGILINNNNELVSYGLNVPPFNNLPEGDDFIDIMMQQYGNESSNNLQAIALRANGSLVAWGSDYSKIVSQTPTTSNFKQLGWFIGWGAIALTNDNTAIGWGDRKPFHNTQNVQYVINELDLIDNTQLRTGSISVTLQKQLPIKFADSFNSGTNYFIVYDDYTVQTDRGASVGYNPNFLYRKGYWTHLRNDLFYNYIYLTKDGKLLSDTNQAKLPQDTYVDLYAPQYYGHNYIFIKEDGSFDYQGNVTMEIPLPTTNNFWYAKGGY